ncbi:esterase/lipase family protein [Herminiimonas arsenitoxidans]|uniref:esterase/lipase family protein n=1 Tax=Herminiimonas arsenitoxidans TaxID=1809410 RepID=UPI000970CFE1|nr:alpha/beta hydrolase [Herminiimonas arsenitoxidans]
MATHRSTDTSNETSELKPPNMLLFALEGRAPWELGAALLAAPLLKDVPKGDGHPVMVLPGLMAGDFLTLFLRRFLKNCGYAAYAWEQGVNLGPRDGLLEECVARVKELSEKHGQKVSLVGWSLGGIYAREIAKAVPHDVRCVITLGSPFTGHPTATNAWRLYQMVSGKPAVDEVQISELKKTPPVPTTSIFSRTDGIVSWQCCIEQETNHSENIEVHGSHTGMVANPTVLYAIADRLAQSDGQWQRFDRNGHQGVKKFIYRDPQRAPRAGGF